eukprot:CAMPEP_0172172062 /NCGR_PEP_ID=MMETSP1050-20130122/12237_1 /TAXON_ID=233186 /ORGANISM="Cryptomonas curvata, Strain CCAP979/52" /LENGTH=32 /DNA_ID= /DNA_START= /DNA_END= /DNA_ORIENTATION=
MGLAESDAWVIARSAPITAHVITCPLTRKAPW